jgi:protease-4
MSLVSRRISRGTSPAWRPMPMFRRHSAALAALLLLAAPALLLADDEKGEKKKGKKDEPATPVVAHIRLAGDLDETPTAADPLFGGSAESFKTKLDRLTKAKDDANVKSVYLQLDDLHIGWGKLDELRRAIADVRAAGKKVYAHLDSADAKGLLTALACDVVAMPESGDVMMHGMRAEVTFYKDFFEKLHLQADFLQMGDYKGAAEPFTRSGMSPQFRQQFETVINDFYEKSYVEAFVKSRPEKKWTAEQVKKWIDEGAFTAKRAKKLGLIDRLAYAEEFEAQMKAETKDEDVRIARHYAKQTPDDVDLSNPFAIFKLLAPPKKKVSKKPKVAVIYAVGAITTGRGAVDPFSGESAVGSATMIEAIRDAEKDETVKAIVLRVDSPGGSALASDLIWKELAACKKPVVASMGDVAASGGYYISMAAKKIYAEPGTLTGSIGVVGGKIVTGGLFDWLGMKTEVISRGANSGLMSSEQPWTESERQVMTKLMQDVYDQFLAKALQGRKKAGVEMTKDKLLTLAGGRIWTGRQAKANGLVDELGTLADAVAEAKKLAGQEDNDLDLLILPRPKTFLERLADSAAETRAPAPKLEQLPMLKGVPGLAGKLRTAGALLRLQGERVWLMPPFHFEVK